MTNDDKLREKCAVVGVSLKNDDNFAAQITYQTLFALQHRGVEASGIVTSNNGVLSHKRGRGMVRDVFQTNDMEELVGKSAVGHNRYSTSGGDEHLQPFIDEQIGFSFAHNGNLPNTTELEANLSTKGIVTARYNDSELMAIAIVQQIHGGLDLPEAILAAYPSFIGAFSCVAMYDGTIVGFRDQFGIRPLEIGKTEDGMIICSETCGLDIVGAKHVRSVEPGEMVVIRNGAIVSSVQIVKAKPKLDMFELVYFARHDSYLYGHCVNEIRREYGKQLAKLHAPWQDDVSNAVILPVPDTSVPAAEGYAAATGIMHELAIIKNRYIGRTFMQTSQKTRQENLRQKHTMISERIKGRDIYLIDDSIVRLNTMPRLVKLAKELEAKSITVLIASAPVRFPDFYGVDTPRQTDLPASFMTIEEMRKEIGCDYLGFLTVDAMVAATGEPASKFNLSVFTGEYPVSIGKHAAEIHKPTSA